MSIAINFEDRVTLPAEVDSFDSFRRGTWSPEFPGSGRIDWVDGQIEIDLQPENLFFHNCPRGEVAGQFFNAVRRGRRGRVFSAGARYCSPVADLSCEPDLTFVLGETMDSGAITLTPTADQSDDSFIEIGGPVDVVVEIVSDSSVTKDLVRLPKAYFAAGVAEMWTLDARGDRGDFVIRTRGESAYVPAKVGDEGYQWSDVFGRAFRLEKFSQTDGHPDYVLHARPPID